MTPPPSRELFAPARFLAFSDGVFSVAITLLVIDLRLPPGLPDAALQDAMLAMAPRFAIFAFTFFLVGINWLSHHRKFVYIHRIDTGLLWLNLLYLMALCLVPFATSVLSEHAGPVGFILYVGVMALVTGFSAALSAYGLRPLFLAKPLPPGVRRDMILRPFITGLIFLASAGAAVAGWLEIAQWGLLAIVPVSMVFGHGRRRVS